MHKMASKSVISAMFLITGQDGKNSNSAIFEMTKMKKNYYYFLNTLFFYMKMSIFF